MTDRGPIMRRVMTVYLASDAEATRQLYADLAERGPAGELAVNLMRACKKSERAKVYRGQRFRSASYDGKQWAMGEICRLLLQNTGLVSAWGWKVDPEQPYHSQVLYVELPTGQVSFHTAVRGAGPDFPGEWDGQRDRASARVCAWAAQILKGPELDQQVSA